MLLATFATAHADDTLGSKQDFMEDLEKIDYFTDPVTIEPIDYFANPATIPAREYPLFPDQKSRLERICEVNSQLASPIPQLSQRCQMENLDQLSEEEKSRLIRAYLTTTYNQTFQNRACDTYSPLVEQIPQLVQYCNRRADLLDQLPEEERLRIIHANLRAHLTDAYNKAVLNRACDTHSPLVEQIPQLAQYCHRRADLLDQLTGGRKITHYPY